MEQACLGPTCGDKRKQSRGVAEVRVGAQQSVGIGQTRVKVFWDGEGKCFEGWVKPPRCPRTGRYRVEYDDGTEAWEQLSELQFLPDETEADGYEKLGLEDGGPTSMKMEALAYETTAMASDGDEIREAAAVGHERYGETQVVRKVDTVIDIQQEKSRQDMEAVR